MADVFISYKSEDRPRVKPLVTALEADGLSVWWDAQLSAGDDWRAAIEKNLESAPCVIVVWSAGSTGPEGRFVRDEATRAQKRRAYLPVRIDPVDPPLGFGEIQAQPLEGWKGSRKDARYQAVLAAARTILEGRPDAPASNPSPAPAAKPGIDRRLILAGGGAAALAAVGAGGFFLWPRKAQAQTLAVLPFANLSGDPAQAYFADGLAEELRSSLTLVPQFRVIGRASSEAVRNDDTKTASSKLGVENIVTGSVRRGQGTLRVTAQLLSGKDGVEHWSQTFDQADGDALAIQSAIAMNVASALQVRLASTDLNIGGTRNAAAQDLVLRYREMVRQDTSDAAVRRGLALLNQAIALDPNYALAWVNLSLAQQNIAGVATTVEAGQRGMREAVASARKAVALERRLPNAHVALGQALSGQLDMAGAETAFRLALQLGPGSPSTLRTAAQGLGVMGHASEALPYVDQAIQLDPLMVTGQAYKATILNSLRRFDEALTLGRQVLARAPKRADTRVTVANALVYLGREREGLEEFQKLEEADYNRTIGQAIVHARLGERAASDQLLDRFRSSFGDAAHFQYAEIRAQQKEVALALTELEAAWTFRDPGLASIVTDPYLDPLRAEPRFKAIVSKLGLKA